MEKKEEWEKVKQELEVTIMQVEKIQASDISADKIRTLGDSEVKPQ